MRDEAPDVYNMMVSWLAGVNQRIDEVIAEASGDKVETGFDPYALGAVAKLKREGEAKLREALDKLSEGEILSLAMAQHLAHVHGGAKT